MCVCSEEELEDSRRVLGEVMELFKVPGGIGSDDPYADAGLISNAIYWASRQDNPTRYYDFSFAADQWAMVTCSEYLYNENIRKYGEFEKEPSDVVSFQCDVIEHGIAACIKYFEEKYINGIL